jgi:hypothetical protein
MNLSITKSELTLKWKLMRSPPPGHFHNWLCPRWQQGDTTGLMRPECPIYKTYTLFDISPFTAEGKEYKRLLDVRDEEARRGKREKWLLRKPLNQLVVIDLYASSNSRKPQTPTPQ